MTNVLVEFSAKISFDLDIAQRNYLMTHRDRMIRKAAMLTFAKAADKDGAILRIMKITPVLQYYVIFYEDIVVATGFSGRLDVLKDFPQMAMAEIALLIGSASDRTIPDPSQYTR